MSIDEYIVCNLHNYTNIIIEGEDTFKFLQGQLSCDMDKILDNQSSYGTYCNIKGRVLSFFDILHFNEKIILNLPSSVADNLISTLKKYAIFSKVSIVKDETLSTFAIYGASSESWIKEFSNSSRLNINQLCNQNEVIIYRLPTITPAFKIIGPQKALLNQFSKCIDTALIEQNDLKWKYFLISHKIPEINESSTELFLPAELGLDKTDAISFSKGCFMGQEIIARMKYIGSMKKELKKIKIDNQNKINIKDKILLKNKSIGEIVDSVSLSDQTSYALALISNTADINSKDLTTSSGAPVSLI